MSQVEMNKQAPDFTLTDLSDQQVSLSDFRGKANVLLVLNRGLA